MAVNRNVVVDKVRSGLLEVNLLNCCKSYAKTLGNTTYKIIVLLVDSHRDECDKLDRLFGNKNVTIVEDPSVFEV